jgi:hypothetical protein
MRAATPSGVKIWVDRYCCIIVLYKRDNTVHQILFLSLAEYIDKYDFPASLACRWSLWLNSNDMKTEVVYVSSKSDP